MKHIEALFSMAALNANQERSAALNYDTCSLLITKMAVLFFRF